MILVDVDRVAASRPGKPLFADLSVTLASGDRLGVVGINGCGKSTLLRVLTGELPPEAGTVRRGRDVRVAALAQAPELPDGTVLAAVEAVAEASWEAASVLDRLGLGDLLDAPTTGLSGGQAKRVALARTLVAPSDLLVLDEPTNHLDIDAVAWLEDRLVAYRGGLVLVTHDRHLLDRVCSKVLELDRGRAHVHEGGYDAYLEGRARREEQAASSESTRRTLARKELAWLRRGAPARTSKPKARIESATRIVEGRAEAAARSGTPDLHFGTPRLGDKVVELEGASFSYGGPPVLQGIDLTLDRRERLGIVGANGTGKSTLLDLVAGRRPPTSGTVVTGPTVQVGYYDQVGVELDPQLRVRDAVSAGREPDWRDAALLESFWFGSDAQWAPIGQLSGGERRRLQLLLVLAAKPNVLLLDEPTNDLDLDTLRVLEDLLDEWPGAVLVVSHDRAFLERTVADVVVLYGAGFAGRRAGAGFAGRRAGGYAAWEDERRAGRQRGRIGGRPPARPPTGSSADGPRATAAAATTTAPAPTAERGAGTGGGAGPRRSPSTLRRLMTEADRQVARLTRRRVELEAELGAVGGDQAQLAEVGRQLAEVCREIDETEERWLALGAEAEGGAA